MALFGSPIQQANQEKREYSSPDHNAWVAQVLTRMQTIQPGMTRKVLLSVFKTEGGLSSPVERTYVSQDCPFFKVTVQFAPVGGPELDGEGMVKNLEDPRDTIVSISQPFLQFGIFD